MNQEVAGGVGVNRDQRNSRVTLRITFKPPIWFARGSLSWIVTEVKTRTRNVRGRELDGRWPSFCQGITQQVKSGESLR